MPSNATGTVIGHLGREVQMRYAGDGFQIAHFSIATNSRRKIREEWRDVTTWWHCTAFGKMAESLSSAPKGALIYCAGEIFMDQWMDTAGELRTSKDPCMKCNVALWVNRPKGEGRPANAGTHATDPAAAVPAAEQGDAGDEPPF